jgi:outer membrane lipoprotein carrier protein
MREENMKDMKTSRPRGQRTRLFGAVLLVALLATLLPGAVVSADEGSAEVAQAEPLGLEQIVANVQAFYDGVESYHADFTQTYQNIALGDSESSSGHVYFRKPGRMRWDYAAPDEKYLISDGEQLWIYEPEFNQVAQMSLRESELPTALRFLMGEGELSADFIITQLECSEEAAYCLHLVPRLSEGQYQSLEFTVDAADFHVRRTVIIDSIGNRNEFVFSSPSTTDELPADSFTFEITEDMRVVNP